MGMRTVLALTLMASLVLTQEGSGNGLPAGHEEILSSPYNPDSFSCDDQAYGYYADVESGCEIFHICLPVQDNEGLVTNTLKFSFFCGNGTVFDQESLVCNHPDSAFPCESHPACSGLWPSGRCWRITRWW